MEPYKLRKLMADAVEIGCMKALIETNVLTRHISKAEAYRVYGRGYVDRWITEGHIKPLRQKGRTKIDRVQLQLIYKTL